MISKSLISAASFIPSSLQSPNAWVGHLPFAAWVIQEISPKIFVELGTHSGNSYFSFCQSVLEAGISTKCYAVDTWQGDEHAGLYKEEVFADVNAHNSEHYAGFSRLLRLTFDDAACYFSDESIDLLHIDGLHTFEAVRHDFETWLPKLAPGAVVMFHDTNVRERNFGVWKQWEELQARYPNNLEFVHSHGLGVLQLNNATDDTKLEWLQPNSTEKQTLIYYFAALGAQQLERFGFNELKQQAFNLNQAAAERDGQIAALNQAAAERDGQIAALNQAAAERDEQIAILNQTAAERDGQTAALNQAAAERDKQIAVLNQAAAERDGQIAALNQAAAERDGQIAALNQAAAERDEQIAVLTQTLAERDEMIRQLMHSTSWRITGPLRTIKYLLRSSAGPTKKQKSQPINFGAKWYLEQNPDVATSGMEPYKHYVTYGKAEGRRLAPEPFLIRNIPRVQVVINGVIFRSIKRIGISTIKYSYHQFPLSQSLKDRIKSFCYQRFPSLFRGVRSYEFWLEGKSTTSQNISTKCELIFESYDWKLLLPAIANTSSHNEPLPLVVDVIVPVYLGLEQTRRCIHSVLNSVVTSPFRLIVINDASPESEITEYLQSLSSTGRVTVIENTENLGFTATVNRGMLCSDTNDVVLLNSDAEVANDWLDKLKRQAYSGSLVCTVTPFSSNATICNYPTLEGLNDLPAGETTQSLDSAFANANKGRNIEIPTAVGFCMYIRRDCLTEIGLFDVETFGKGYGEENDFSLRASAKGWKHLLAADTFVYHEGGVSFQTGSNPRKERATKIMRERYPQYESNVAKHVAMNEAYPLRVAATAARFKQSDLPVVLHVLHAHGGGTEKHVEELCRSHFGKAKLLIMTPPFAAAGKPVLQIRSADRSDALDLHLPTSNVEFLVSLFQSFGVSLIHIHHVLGYQFDLRYLVEALGVPFYLTVHDYFLICPRINLMPPRQDYCGEPEPRECNQCLSADFPQGANDIIWWRENHAWLFSNSSVVICPSKDVANRCQRYFPYAVYRIVGHENLLADTAVDIKAPALNEDEPFRVAILGVLAGHKGLALIREALLAASKIDAPLQFHLIGFVDGDMPSLSSALFTQTGRYDDTALPKMIEDFNPHLILFPARSPETYSYTLTAALNSGRPLMVPDIGAFSERVASRPWTWIIGWNITPTQLIDKLCEIRAKYCYPPTPPEVYSEIVSTAVIEESGFYEDEYLTIAKNLRGDCEIIDLRKPGKIAALVLVENVGVLPSPCAYIRLILPLIRERGDKLNLRWVTDKDVSHYKADVLICQRTAVTPVTAIDKIVSHCRENNIRIVYDLDDLLLALPDDHPEHSMYALKSAAVFRWLIEADEVWVSTEALQHRVCEINARTRVVPNYLDDQLWIKPKTPDNKRGANETVRLLYMGTQTHLADFELVKKVLQRLKNEFLERIEISLIGITASTSREGWYTTLVPPQTVGSGYPAFVNWISNGQGFDIGITPLVDNEFNRCKSAIKFLDYSALGMATVASDLGVYVPIRHGENGFLVKNTEEAWYETLKNLITDHDLRSRVQYVAQSEVFNKYSYECVGSHRTKLLATLLSETSERAVKVSSVALQDNTETSELKTVDVNRNLVATAFLTGIGIEIGALHNPLPIPNGAHVRYVDRMDKPGLYQQYPELRQHNLVDVDFVDNGETLLTFDDDTQDFIIANHFLEHCEDPIATLRSFCRVLRTGGVVFMALPDMRATFDINRQRTTLAHLIRDHSEGPATSRLEHYREWAELVEPHFGRVYGTREKIERRAHELMTQSYSIHFHVWQPTDVQEMLRYCSEQQTPLDIACFISQAEEMIIILRKTTNRTQVLNS